MFLTPNLVRQAVSDKFDNVLRSVRSARAANTASRPR
jgi:hypothetical protein